MKQRILTILLAFIIIGSSFTACNDSEPLPALLQIDTMQVQINSSLEGSGSHNIKSVVVFVNEQSLGLFDLPVTVPVLATGEAEVTLQAYIDAFANNRKAYPFYSLDQFTVNLTPLETSVVNGTIAYRDNAFFAFNTDFEVSSNFEDTDQNNTLLQLTSNQNLVYEGVRSAKVELNEANTLFSIQTIDYYTLPGNNTPVYLELNYRCSAPFQIAIEAIKDNSTQIIWPEIYINTKENWNKVYIELTETVSNLALENFTSYKIIFRGELADEDTEATFYWDNIKLIYQF